MSLRYGRLASLTLVAAMSALGGLLTLQQMSARGVGAAPRGTAPAPVPVVSRAQLTRQFDDKTMPFLMVYCTECHSGAGAAASLDLDAKDVDGMAALSRKLPKIAEMLEKKRMPPANSDKQPAADERAAAIAWFKGLAADEIKTRAGDPGVVLAHRLSNAEYNYTIKDLTGVDIAPAKEFPVDPANQAGFDNSGESLMMDPELLKKYLDAARQVADYMVFQSEGVGFAPHPAVVETDRDKYAVNRIIEFYKRQPTDLGAYLLAAWQYEQGKSRGATVESIASQAGVSAKYLKMVYGALTNEAEKIGPAAGLAAWWRSMKDADGLEAQRKLAAKMADWVHALRAATRPTFPDLRIQGMDIGSQPLVMPKVLQIEATRYAYQAGTALKMPAEAYAPETPAAEAMKAPAEPAAVAEYEKAFERFGAVFPDEYLITERSPVYLNPNSGEGKLKGHLLNAGLHNQTGFFRDDRPLCELILSEEAKKELDRLWTDLYMITDAPLRQFQSMIWFERTDSTYMSKPDFNFVRAEDMDLGEEPKFSRLRDTFIKDLNPRASAAAKKAVADYFDFMEKFFKQTAEARVKAETKQLEALVQLAAKAYRRPLAEAEKKDLLAFYNTLRTDGALDREEAMRDVLVSILMSPHFCYHLVTPPIAAAGSQALSDYELASRLSYFLWSSMPDAELMAHAAKGDLHSSDVLLAQAHRMLKDDRVVDLATEFGGNWLDFRQFETFNGVDRERFPAFDNALRESMYQEPIRFLTNILRNDAPVLDVLYGDYTFVNAQLAKHYGMPYPAGATGWVRVEGASKYDRGGMLPMAVFLTKNSPGLRTSPVKRGYWVVKRVLGEEIPAPPPNVPALPPDESKMELSLPQALARHRSDENCAICHVRFDAMGLVFEGFGPTGQVRKTDMAGKPVENTAAFPSGAEGTGLAGLRTYIKQQREGDFLNNLCEKLLADALGRSLVLSDEPLLAQMRQNLEKNQYRFSALIDTIVASPQFLNKRPSGAAVKG